MFFDLRPFIKALRKNELSLLRFAELAAESARPRLARRLLTKALSATSKRGNEENENARNYWALLARMEWTLGRYSAAAEAYAQARHCRQNPDFPSPSDITLLNNQAMALRADDQPEAALALLRPRLEALCQSAPPLGDAEDRQCLRVAATAAIDIGTAKRAADWLDAATPPDGARLEERLSWSNSKALVLEMQNRFSEAHAHALANADLVLKHPTTPEIDSVAVLFNAAIGCYQWGQPGLGHYYAEMACAPERTGSTARSDTLRTDLSLFRTLHTAPPETFLGKVEALRQTGRPVAEIAAYLDLGLLNGITDGVKDVAQHLLHGAGDPFLAGYATLLMLEADPEACAQNTPECETRLLAALGSPSARAYERRFFAALLALARAKDTPEKALVWSILYMASLKTAAPSPSWGATAGRFQIKAECKTLECISEIFWRSGLIAQALRVEDFARLVAVGVTQAPQNIWDDTAETVRARLIALRQANRRCLDPILSKSKADYLAHDAQNALNKLQKALNDLPSLQPPKVPILPPARTGQLRIAMRGGFHDFSLHWRDQNSQGSIRLPIAPILAPLRSQYASSSSHTTKAAARAELADVLLPPLETALSQCTAIEVDATGLAAMIPLGQLEWDGQPIACSHKVSVLLPLQDHAASVPSGSGIDWVCLPFASTEMNIPQPLRSAEVPKAIRGESTRLWALPSLLAQSADIELHPRVLHISGHMARDHTHPEATCVNPGDQTRYTLDDILRRLEPAGADLVFLAGCFSAGAPVGADRYPSNAYAVLRRGTRALLATMCEVEDSKTNSFVDAFYTCIAQGLAPADALRKAQSQSRGNAPGAANLDWILFTRSSKEAVA